MFQVRHNEGALEQLIKDGGALPKLADLLIPSQPVLVQEQAAKLVAALASGSESAKQAAVEVSRWQHQQYKCNTHWEVQVCNLLLSLICGRRPQTLLTSHSFVAGMFVQVGVVPLLLGLLASSAEHVVLHASAALMNISVSRDGKYALLQSDGGLSQLAVVLHLRQHHQLCINVMETLTNVAEAPETRAALEQLGVPAQLVAIHAADDSPQLLKDRALQAMRQCAFTHLPYPLLAGKQAQSA